MARRVWSMDEGGVVAPLLSTCFQTNEEEGKLHGKLGTPKGDLNRPDGHCHFFTLP
jgi:hypothetical protein